MARKKACTNSFRKSARVAWPRLMLSLLARPATRSGIELVSDPIAEPREEKNVERQNAPPQQRQIFCRCGRVLRRTPRCDPSLRKIGQRAVGNRGDDSPGYRTEQPAERNIDHGVIPSFRCEP